MLRRGLHDFLLIALTLLGAEAYNVCKRLGISDFSFGWSACRGSSGTP